VAVALRAPAGNGLRRTFGRPFPTHIGFADVGGIVHRLVRDRLEGLAPAVSDTNGGTDLQPHGTEVAGVGRDSKAAKVFPLAGKAHSETGHVFLFLVALGEHFVDFFLKSGRPGDDRRKLIKR